MKKIALAVIAVILLFSGCIGDGKTTGSLGSSAPIGSDAQIAVGFINPVVTLLNMSKYWLYGSNAYFTGNITATNFFGNLNWSYIQNAPNFSSNGTGGSNLTYNLTPNTVVYAFSNSSIASSTMTYNMTTGNFAGTRNSSNFTFNGINATANFYANGTPGFTGDEICAGQNSPLTYYACPYKEGLRVGECSQTTNQAYGFLSYPMEDLDGMYYSDCSAPTYNQAFNGMTFADDDIYCNRQNFKIPNSYKADGSLFYVLDFISLEDNPTKYNWYIDVSCIKRCEKWTEPAPDIMLSDVCESLPRTPALSRAVSIDLRDASMDCARMQAGDVVQIKLWRDPHDESSYEAYALAGTLAYEDYGVNADNWMGKP